MNRFVSVCVAGLAIAAAGCESTRSAAVRHPPSTPFKTRLAVVPVQGGGNLQSGLTEMLTAELLQTGRFIVLERASLADVQAEQARGADPGFWNEGGVQSRYLPARVLLSIKAIHMGTEEDALVGTLMEGKGGGFRVKRAKVMMEVKLMDVGTAQVLASRVIDASATGGDLAAGVGAGGTIIGTAVFNSSAVGKAAKEAIKKSVRFIIDQFPPERWETRVAGVSPEGKIYIAAGSDEGLQTGRRLNLFRLGDPVIDPATGIQLAIPERQIGVVSVDQVWEGYSMGTAVSDTLPKRGDILRPADR